MANLNFSFQGDENPPLVSWSPTNNKLYTLAVRNRDVDHVNFLATNIPGTDLNRSSVLLPYESTRSGRNYEVMLHEQPGVISDSKATRTNFDMNEFARNNNLTHVETSTLETKRGRGRPKRSSNKKSAARGRSVSPSPTGRGRSPTRVASPVRTTRGRSVSPRARSPNGRFSASSSSTSSNIIKKNSNLTEKEKKYCSCVLKVAAKQPASCNRNVNSKAGTNSCANSFATCAKSTGGSNRKCGENYNFEGMDDTYLKAYAELSRIAIPSPYSRSKMIDNIYEAKAKKYGK